MFSKGKYCTLCRALMVSLLSSVLFSVAHPKYLECPVLGWQPWAVGGTCLNAVPFISQFAVTKVVLWQLHFSWCSSLELVFKSIVGFWVREEREYFGILFFLTSSKNQNFIKSASKLPNGLPLCGSGSWRNEKSEYLQN